MPEIVRRAVDEAEAALRFDFPAHARYEVLQRAAALVEARQEDYAWSIAREGSKTIREARREPSRAANILRLSAEEGRRIAGETLPFDSRKGSENRVGYYMRVPAGVIGAIAPFNDPLAVAAHKIGPALAAGNAIVYKSSPLSRAAPEMLGRDLMEAGLPAGRLSVVDGGDEAGEALVRDARVRVLSFTGGVATGERIAAAAGIKKLLLELGSNSPVIVLADADLPRAVSAVCDGAFAQAGQNCLGVQRVFVEDSVYREFATSLANAAGRLRVGSALDESTDVCGLITEAQAVRVERWVREAVESGARVLTGGRRDDALYWPTVLEGVPAGAKLDCEEVYGPVVSLYSVRTLDEAIERANAVRFGLHAAIFTESLNNAFRAIRELRAGAVIVNDSTDYRLDVMPFGGVKSSGIGREGIRFAIEEMTEIKVVCLNLRHS
ncbi:MAG TPA: aldehyde dehydrogenase family protein [Bryobacteraceae bacterium]|nr:aldehyde dehydrogenase family protein [Bryobacteraceae bacterium]